MDLPGDSYWVEEGLLLAGPYPGDPDPSREREKLGAFLALGIRRFVDLTEPGEHSPYAPMLREVGVARGAKTSHHRMAIRDESVPSPTLMRAILDLIGADLGDRSPVYLHCRGGAGRTGTVVGCFLIERGDDPEQALAEISADRSQLDSKRRLWSSPETDEQRSFVLNWTPGMD